MLGMDKKDIYEHLAEIYLDASSKHSKKKKKKQHRNPAAWGIFLGAGVFVMAAVIASGIFLRRDNSFRSEIALIMNPGVAKINFNFEPARKEIYALELNNLDLARYKTLGFSVKKSSYSDRISLRIEFTSIYKEKSEVYIRDLPYKWQDIKIAFKDFKNIADWSQVQTLSFGVEQLKTKGKKGVGYVDNVRVIK